MGRTAGLTGGLNKLTAFHFTDQFLHLRCKDSFQFFQIQRKSEWGVGVIKTQKQICCVHVL